MNERNRPPLAVALHYSGSGAPRVVAKGGGAVAERIVATARYYVRVAATAGTLAERDADDVGDLVFGRESEASGLGSLGRTIFRTVIKVSDYLQSVSTETTSRRMSGGDLLKP